MCWELDWFWIEVVEMHFSMSLLLSTARTLLTICETVKERCERWREGGRLTRGLGLRNDTVWSSLCFLRLDVREAVNPKTPMGADQ